MNEAKIKCPQKDFYKIEMVEVNFCKTVCQDRTDCPAFIEWLNSKIVNCNRNV